MFLSFFPVFDFNILIPQIFFFANHIFMFSSYLLTDAIGTDVLPVIISLQTSWKTKEEALNKATESKIPIIHFKVSYNLPLGTSI